MEKITFNPDGTIPKLPLWSTTGVNQIGTLNPYRRVEGKKIADRILITSVHNGDYIKVQGVDFSTGASSVDVSVASLSGGK